MNELSSVWSVQNGKFNDGVEEVQPVNGAVPKRGNYFKQLMDLHNISEQQADTHLCIDCGVSLVYTAISMRHLRCISCTESFKKGK